MRRTLVALVVLAAAVTPGCLRDFEDPGRVDIRGLDVAAPHISSGRVTLEVATTLDNRGGDSAPIELDVKAYSTRTGLRVARNRTDVGALPGDTTREIPTRVEVPRRDGVRIEAILFADGRATEHARVSVDNVGSLQPNVRATGLAIPSIDFHVQQVSTSNGSDRARIEARVHLTNEGDDPSGTFEVQVKAREVSTDLIADEGRRDAGDVGPGETRIFPVTLDVPDGFNYEVEAILWDGAFIVERGADHVQLRPEETIDEDKEIVVSDPDLRDFVRSDGDGAGEEPDEEAQPTVPGPGLPAAVAAAALSLWIVRRRRRH